MTDIAHMSALEDARSDEAKQPSLIGRTLIYCALVAVSFVMLYPLLWMVSSSFKPENEIFSTTSLIPQTFTLEAYGRGWNGLSVSFGWMFFNSLVISVLTVIGNLISCSMAAYAFTRLQFKGRGFWFALMLGTMMMPQHAVLIPQYLMFLKFGWVNTVMPLVVPKFFAIDAFFIFLMVQFFRGIPRDLDEAAVMDGAGPLRIFTKIILPLPRRCWQPPQCSHSSGPGTTSSRR